MQAVQSAINQAAIGIVYEKQGWPHLFCFLTKQIKARKVTKRSQKKIDFESNAPFRKEQKQKKVG